MVLTRTTALGVAGALLSAALGIAAAISLRMARRTHLLPQAQPTTPIVRCRTLVSIAREGGGTGAIALAYHPRDPGEWQGMPVEETLTMPCRTSADCTMMNACVDGLCLGCDRDDQCAEGEVCVLSHCVPARLARCRSRRDCEPGKLCVLSGYSHGHRSNARTRAECVGPDDPFPKNEPGAVPPPPGAPERPARTAPPRPPPTAMDYEVLFESIRAEK